jgi:sugar transferase (PEP-CTERM system associated)
LSHIRLFRHYLHVPYVILGVIDGLVLLCAFYLAVFFRFFNDWGLFSESLHQIMGAGTIFFVFVNLFAMTALGVYQAKIEDGLAGMMLRTIFSTIACVVFLLFAYYVASDYLWYFGYGTLTLATLLGIFLLGVFRSIFFFTVRDKLFKRTVLILGAGKRAKSILDDLKEPLDQKGFIIKGFVPFFDETVSITKERLIDIPTTLHDYVLANPVDEIVVAMEDRRKKLPLDELLECKMEGVNIVDIATFYERESRKLSMEMMQPSWMIFSDGFIASEFTRYVKRGFDIFASLSLLAVTWPFMVLTMLAIKMEEGLKAPVIYSQERVGLNNKPFLVHKFRSMRIDAEKPGQAVWAQKNDSRVTRVGDFIRKVRIDELPQIFNVLKGNMAFVGPRPERPVFVDQLGKNIPYYRERHRVKPGITGWAQLCFAYADSEEDSKEKLRYDLYYIKNHSVMLDLIILTQTVEVILFKKGSR